MSNEEKSFQKRNINCLIPQGKPHNTSEENR